MHCNQSILSIVPSLMSIQQSITWTNPMLHLHLQFMQHRTQLEAAQGTKRATGKLKWMLNSPKILVVLSKETTSQQSLPREREGGGGVPLCGLSTVCSLEALYWRRFKFSTRLAVAALWPALPLPLLHPLPAHSISLSLSLSRSVPSWPHQGLRLDTDFSFSCRFVPQINLLFKRSGEREPTNRVVYIHSGVCRVCEGLGVTRRWR